MANDVFEDVKPKKITVVKQDDGTEMVVEINFTTKVRDTPAATRSTCQHTAPM